jgi:hypothetical protein
MSEETIVTPEEVVEDTVITGDDIDAEVEEVEESVEEE